MEWTHQTRRWSQQQEREGYLLRQLSASFSNSISYSVNVNVKIIASCQAAGVLAESLFLMEVEQHTSLNQNFQCRYIHDQVKDLIQIV